MGGNLDADVSAASFDLEMKTAAGTVSCKGDAGTSKTCNLPLGVGSLTFNAMNFPIKKGSTSVSVDLSLSPALPGALAHTDTKVTATATNGDSLFCVEIKTAPAEGEDTKVAPADENVANVGAKDTCLKEDEWGCGSFGKRCCPGLDCFFHSGQGASGSCVESSGPPTVNASSAKEDCSTGPCDDAPCCDGLVCGAEGAPGWCVEPSGPPTVNASIVV